MWCFCCVHVSPLLLSKATRRASSSYDLSRSNSQGSLSGEGRTHTVVVLTMTDIFPRSLPSFSHTSLPRLPITLCWLVHIRRHLHQLLRVPRHGHDRHRRIRCSFGEISHAGGRHRCRDHGRRDSCFRVRNNAQQRCRLGHRGANPCQRRVGFLCRTLLDYRRRNQVGSKIWRTDSRN